MKTRSRAASPTSFLALGLLLLGASACGDHDHGPGDGQTRLCDAEPRGETFVVGLEKTSRVEGLKVRLLEVVVEEQPQPPDRGINTWTFEITDAAGAPVEDVAVRLRPWMPDHGHGTTPAEYPGVPAGAGRYSVGPFNLFMSGLWEFTVRLERGGELDDAKFGFCLEG